MTMFKMAARIAAALCLALPIAGCPEFRALNDALEREMYAQHPAGPAGIGLDAFIASQQIRVLTGR